MASKYLRIDFEAASLKEAKQWLRERANQGAFCPCCNQHVKIYKRTIFSSMAMGLILLHKYTDPTSDFIHVSELIKRRPGALNGGTLAKLAYWGLATEKRHSGRDKAKRNSGFWRITKTGVDFANDRITLPKYASTYNQRVLGLSGEQISIRDCLGDKFNYAELMGR